MILVILDGAADDGALRGKTPLEAANGPSLERMRREGVHGLLDNAPEGMPVDSLTCIATLLGVPPGRIPRGRAYLEALAAGVPVGKNQVVCRCNRVRLTEDGRLLSANAGGDFPPPDQWDGFRLYPLTGYKSLLVGDAGPEGPEAAAQTRTFPPHEYLGERVESLLPQGSMFAEGLRRFARRSTACAEDSALRMLFPWDVSARRELPSFAELHGGMRGACVCATEIVHGLCMAMGVPVTVPPGATAFEDTDLAAKAAAALKLAGEYDLVIVHVNGADEAAHRRDPLGKAAFLARADRELLAPLLEGSPEGERVLVTSDHATLSRTGRHSGGPQPFWLWEKGRILEATGPIRHDGRDTIPLLKGAL